MLRGWKKRRRGGNGGNYLCECMKVADAAGEGPENVH